MVAHKCTPLRNTVRHRQGAAAVERKAAVESGRSKSGRGKAAVDALRTALAAALRPLSDLERLSETAAAFRSIALLHAAAFRSATAAPCRCRTVFRSGVHLQPPQVAHMGTLQKIARAQSDSDVERPP